MRVRSWFVSTCLCLAVITAAIAMTPPELSAGIVPSHGLGPAYSRDVDLERIQRVLEGNMVRQKLLDYGVSPREAMDKVRRLDDKELHLLATKMEGIPEGSSIAGVDSAGAILIVLVILAVAVVITFLVLGAKAFVTDMRNKPQPENAPPEPLPSPAGNR